MDSAITKDKQKEEEIIEHLKKENVRLISDVVMLLGNTNMLPDIIHELISRHFGIDK